MFVITLPKQLRLSSLCQKYGGSIKTHPFMAKVAIIVCIIATNLVDQRCSLNATCMRISSDVYQICANNFVMWRQNMWFMISWNNNEITNYLQGCCLWYHSPLVRGACSCIYSAWNRENQRQRSLVTRYLFSHWCLQLLLCVTMNILILVWKNVLILVIIIYMHIVFVIVYRTKVLGNWVLCVLTTYAFFSALRIM